MPFDINDEETKTAVAKMIEEAVGPLKTKNGELLNELKEARKGKTIDPAEVEKLEAKVDDLTSQLTAAQKEAKTAKANEEKATKALETESGFTRSLLIQNGLKDTLIKGGVKDEDFIDALVSKFSPGATIAVEGDTRKAMIGDKEMSAAVAEYLASDAGKKFVAAPNNSGGGAGGGKGGDAGKAISSSDFAALNPKDRAAKMAEGFVIKDAA